MDYENKKLKEIVDYESMLDKNNSSLTQTVEYINDNMDNLVKIYSKEKKGILPFSYTDIKKVEEEKPKPMTILTYKELVS
jgi:hypothetical protein